MTLENERYLQVNVLSKLFLLSIFLILFASATLQCYVSFNIHVLDDTL
jgi:hypothetical protein